MVRACGRQWMPDIPRASAATSCTLMPGEWIGKQLQRTVPRSCWSLCTSCLKPLDHVYPTTFTFHLGYANPHPTLDSLLQEWRVSYMFSFTIINVVRFLPFPLFAFSFCTPYSFLSALQLVLLSFCIQKHLHRATLA